MINNRQVSVAKLLGEGTSPSAVLRWLCVTANFVSFCRCRGLFVTRQVVDSIITDTSELRRGIYYRWLLVCISSQRDIG